MSPFIAFDLSIELNRLLSELHWRSRNADLYRQLRRAASSVSLNLAEGSGRAGADRRQHFRFARGSALESRACLLVGHAWGDLDDKALEPVMPVIDRLLRILAALSR